MNLSNNFLFIVTFNKIMSQSIELIKQLHDIHNPPAIGWWMQKCQ